MLGSCERQRGRGRRSPSGEVAGGRPAFGRSAPAAALSEAGRCCWEKPGIISWSKIAAWRASPVTTSAPSSSQPLASTSCAALPRFGPVDREQIQVACGVWLCHLPRYLFMRAEAQRALYQRCPHLHIGISAPDKFAVSPKPAVRQTTLLSSPAVHPLSKLRCSPRQPNRRVRDLPVSPLALSRSGLYYFP
jgi:hypothetical protein